MHQSSSCRYFYKDVVGLVNSSCQFTDTQTMVTSYSYFSWQVFIATAAVWVFVYFCVWRGINSSSLIVWVTVPLPVFFILVMVVKGLTLPGADLGLRMYVLGYSRDDQPPDWRAKLADIDMWAEAIGQIFFSMGLCMGTTVSYASFN